WDRAHAGGAEGVLAGRARGARGGARADHPGGADVHGGGGGAVRAIPAPRRGRLGQRRDDRFHRRDDAPPPGQGAGCVNVSSILQSRGRGGEGALSPEDVAALRCPHCRAGVAMGTREMRCRGCEAAWPVVDGIPELYRESEVTGKDRLMRAIYDALPSWHDPLTAALAPILQATTERRGRERIMPWVDPGSITPRAGEPIRILDVGIGSGANIPYLRRDLPRGVPVEIWGIDLSRGM